MRLARAYIGTSGWNYRWWGQGVFYPRGLSATEWLDHYARHFATVEPNTTFYGLPHRRTFAAWRARVPLGFRFAVKANRYITHVKRLRDPATSVARFLRAAAGLGPALGPLLFQLPGAWHADAERLSGLAEYLGRQQILPGAQAALEVRHGSWLAPHVLSLLERLGWALCLADWPELPVEGPLTAPFVYVRRHGPGALYASGYSPAALERDARRVKGWLAEGRQVYVYFNNDAEGHAVRDAAALGRLVGEGAAWWDGPAPEARRRAGEPAAAGSGRKKGTGRFLPVPSS